MERLYAERVAVIDDDVRIIRLVERMLNSCGFGMEPVTTPDVDDAVRVVAGAGCFAALVDLRMYGSVCGFSIVETLRKCPATHDMRLIVTSSVPRDLARRGRFLVDQHCAVLLKPFTGDDLMSRIRAATESGVDAVGAVPLQRGANWPPALHPIHVEQ